MNDKKKKPLSDFDERTVFIDQDSAKSKPDEQYTQFVILIGNKRVLIPEYIKHFNLHVFQKVLSPKAIGLIGVGGYFDPLIQHEIDCRCVNIRFEIMNGFNFINEAADLHHLVEFLRTGDEHGNSTSGI